MNPNVTHDGQTPDDPRLVEAVQQYMTALDAGQRPNRRDFVAQHPEIAGELSACLDGLAFVHSIAGQMNHPAPEAAPRAPELDPATAQPIGDFRLVREIGRGGMGTVYEAVQLSLGRRVALKILPFAAALDSRHLERFRNEAQAAARLHHTNIVPVYSVGCDRSIHFYAMQLIEGRSLAEVIRELRQLTSPDAPTPADAETRTAIAVANSKANPLPARPAIPRSAITKVPITSAYSPENLSTLRTQRGSAYSHSVAGFGLQVAEALDYAHRAGIVHRDIKPANLLLDLQGCLWVTDFGLAQFYAQTDLTRSGDLLGTLRYMSPEQASGRAVVLDQRTDIYSLGVTLYELLTLQPAYTGRTSEALLHQLAHDEPILPRSIDRTIPRELEVILCKAMAKDPADRYPSAGALADDLRRFLHDEPIQARPPSAYDRALKWTRRHKALTRSALAIIFLAAVGFSISTFLIAREQSKTATAYQKEREKALEADIQRTRAERASRQARSALDFFSRLAAEEMDKPEFTDVRREMLEESLSYYQSFLDDGIDTPSVSAELSAARTRVQTFLTHFSALDSVLRASFRVRLLSEDSVLKDLKLASKEAASALEFSADFAPRQGENMSDLRSMTAEQKGIRFAARSAEIDAAMIRILGPDRAERLRQIQRQTSGPLAFSDPEIVQSLGFTHAQRAKIRTLQSQFRNARFGPGPRREEDYEPIRAETLSGILATFTPTQLETWKSLIGPPFTGKVSDIGNFWRGGKGPGGRHGGRGDESPDGPRRGNGPTDSSDSGLSKPPAPLNH